MPEKLSKSSVNHYDNLSMKLSEDIKAYLDTIFPNGIHPTCRKAELNSVGFHLGERVLTITVR